jgi:hypothetical protein
MRTEEVEALTRDNMSHNQNLNTGAAEVTSSLSPEPVKEYAIEFNNVSRKYRLHHESKLTLQDRVVNIFRKNNSYEDFWALKVKPWVSSAPTGPVNLPCSNWQPVL